MSRRRWLGFRASARGKSHIRPVKTLYLVVLLGLGAPALAQEASTPQPADVEEVIVPGPRAENVRVEIEHLTEVAVDGGSTL